jgi:hypothetical protein
MPGKKSEKPSGVSAGEFHRSAFWISILGLGYKIINIHPHLQLENCLIF